MRAIEFELLQYQTSILRQVGPAPPPAPAPAPVVVACECIRVDTWQHQARPAIMQSGPPHLVTPARPPQCHSSPSTKRERLLAQSQANRCADKQLCLVPDNAELHWHVTNHICLKRLASLPLSSSYSYTHWQAGRTSMSELHPCPMAKSCTGASNLAPASTVVAAAREAHLSAQPRRTGSGSAAAALAGTP